MAHDVFISYSSHDSPTANAVCDALEAQSVQCWIAPRDIVPGLDWSDAIIDAIVDCKVFLLVLSKSSNESEQVKREVQNAVSERKHIFTFLIEEVDLTKHMRYFIGTPHWMDALKPPIEPHLLRVAQSMRKLIDSMPEKAAQAAARTAAPAPAPLEGAATAIEALAAAVPVTAAIADTLPALSPAPVIVESPSPVVAEAAPAIVAPSPAHGAVSQTVAPSPLRAEVSQAVAPSPVRTEVSQTAAPSPVRTKVSQAVAPTPLRAEVSQAVAPSPVRTEVSQTAAPPPMRAVSPVSTLPPVAKPRRWGVAVGIAVVALIGGAVWAVVGHGAKVPPAPPASGSQSTINASVPATHYASGASTALLPPDLPAQAAGKPVHTAPVLAARHHHAHAPLLMAHRSYDSTVKHVSTPAVPAIAKSAAPGAVSTAVSASTSTPLATPSTQPAAAASTPAMAGFVPSFGSANKLGRQGRFMANGNLRQRRRRQGMAAMGGQQGIRPTAMAGQQQGMRSMAMVGQNGRQGGRRAFGGRRQGMNGPMGYPHGADALRIRKRGLRGMRRRFGMGA